MSVPMFGNKMHGVATALSVSLLMAFASACAPVIMEPARELPRIPASGASPRFVGDIVIVTAGLEKNDDLIDPEGLGAYLAAMRSEDGIMTDTRISVVESASGQGFPRAEIILDRMDYTIIMRRPPPSPPCGLPILYPLIAPFMLAREYFQPQALIEGSFVLYDEGGRVEKQVLLSESAHARASIFNMGGDKTRRELSSRAISRFSRSVVRQIYP